MKNKTLPCYTISDQCVCNKLDQQIQSSGDV